MAQATLNYHPLVNTMTTAIGRDDLVRFLEATGHAPRIRAGLAARSPDDGTIALPSFVAT